MEGCIVGIFDIDAEGAVETGRLVTEGGGTAHPQTVDIGDYRAVEEAVADFETKAGPTDILVNNAGWDQPFNFLDTEPDFWDKVIRINLNGHKLGRAPRGERVCQSVWISVVDVTIQNKN